LGVALVLLLPLHVWLARKERRARHNNHSARQR